MITDNRGFIAISTALILSAIFLSISLSMSLRAISGTDASIAFHERDTARFVAHGCLDYARMELIRTLDYVGDESILVGRHTCTILPIAGSGSSARVLLVEATVGRHTVRISDVIQEISPHMILESSERVVSF